MILGDGRLKVRLETLPGERVLWQGGPPRRAILVRLARAFVPWLVLLGFFAAMLSFLAVLTSVDPPPQRVAAAATPVGHSRPRPIAVAVLALGACAVAAVPLLSVARALRESRDAYNVVTNERICIQSGGLTRGIAIIDLDKVLSIEASSSVLERRLGLQTIRIIHAGTPSAPTPFLLTAPNVMAFVPADDHLLSDVVNAWLPRDNSAARLPSGLG